ncbi:hypothetical protein CBM2587_A20119 [Cupriavidus taiwanensis]|uniref:Uncharacterized protein n=1 Tax=Cupriavidus taiwanensis TaxID=164546 RepID=A0A375BPR7_9BURK|nr:hypothetical protein CBM2587_A20119 [Cupriavidus taiwanensis]
MFTPRVFLPSPACGRGVGGEGREPPRSETLVVLPAPALTPGPSPARGRGEHTALNGKSRGTP